MTAATVVTAEELKEWKHMPATQYFLQMLRDSRQETMELWARKAYIGDTAEQSAAMNASALGGIQVLDQVIDMIENQGE